MALVRDKVGISARDASNILDSMLETITEIIASGSQAVIPKLGVFEVTSTPARPGRNPKTGEFAEVPAKLRPVFHPSDSLRDRMKAHRQNRAWIAEESPPEGEESLAGFEPDDFSQAAEWAGLAEKMEPPRENELIGENELTGEMDQSGEMEPSGGKAPIGENEPIGEMDPDGSSQAAEGAGPFWEIESDDFSQPSMGMKSLGDIRSSDYPAHPGIDFSALETIDPGDIFQPSMGAKPLGDIESGGFSKPPAEARSHGGACSGDYPSRPGVDFSEMESVESSASPSPSLDIESGGFVEAGIAASPGKGSKPPWKVKPKAAEKPLEEKKRSKKAKLETLDGEAAFEPLEGKTRSKKTKLETFVGEDAFDSPKAENTSLEEKLEAAVQPGEAQMDAVKAEKAATPASEVEVEDAGGMTRPEREDGDDRRALMAALLENRLFLCEDQKAPKPPLEDAQENDPDYLKRYEEAKKLMPSIVTRFMISVHLGYGTRDGSRRPAGGESDWIDDIKKRRESIKDLDPFWVAEFIANHHFGRWIEEVHKPPFVVAASEDAGRGDDDEAV